MAYDDEEAFWKYLVEQHWPDYSEAQVLIHSVDAAFTPVPGSTDGMVVHSNLVQYLAGWMRDEFDGRGHRSNRVCGTEANHFLSCAFRGLYATVVKNIMNGHPSVWVRDDSQPMYGCLKIPPELYKKCRAAADEQAAYRTQFE